MRIEFKAYADDYTVRGELELRGERLSDFLVGADEIEIASVAIRALDDGRTHDLPSAVIPLDELCLVAGTGPRGRSDRRVRTRPHPMRAEAGPYAVVGYFHALPTADPRLAARHREIIALSPARLEFAVAGERVEETHDALLMIRSKLTHFESASNEDVGLANALEDSLSVDPQAKDLTGDIRRGPEG